MQILKELTNFISHVQTVYPFYDIEHPRFGLVSSSKATKSFFLSFLLGFTIFPPDFTHKLKHIEIVLDGDRLDQSDNEYTFCIQNISQEFADLKEFKDKLSEYISSLPSQEPSFSQAVQIKIYGKNLPNIAFFDLPEIETKRNNIDNQMYDANDEETQRRRCVKDFIQGHNNIILYILNEETPISETNFIEYIRKYDVDCLRSLLIFDKILRPDAPSNSLHFHEIQKSLQSEGLRPKFGFTLIKQHLNTVEVDNYQDEMHHQGNRLKGNGNNDRVWLKLKDIAQYSLRRVFPGLLDQLKATAVILQSQLKNVMDEAERKNVYVVVHGNNPVGEYTDRVYKEFRDEVLKHRIAKIEEKPLKQARNRAKTNLKKEKPSPSQNESIVQRKGSTSSSNQTEIIETAPDFDGEIIYSPEETTYSHRIRQLLNHIYKQEENKYDIEHFRDVSEEEMEIILQTAETKTIGSLIQSQGFQFLVSSKLRWAIRSTYEAMSHTYDLILQFMESLLDRYFLKLPIIQETLKEDFKNYFDQKRQDVVQMLNTFLNSQINYVYFNEPQMFLYALLEHGGKNKKQGAKEGSIEFLMQQISDASEIYCDDVLQTLKRCIPKMIGQLYLEDIVAKAKTKIEEFIEIVAQKNSKAKVLVDPFKEKIDDLQRKLYAIQKSEHYIYQNSGSQIFVWIEGLNHNHNLHVTMEAAPRKRGMSFDESAASGGIEHNGDFHIMKKANQAHPQLGPVRKKSLGVAHNSNHPVQESKKSIHEHHHIKSRQIVFEGSQVIQDYFIRNQRLQAYVLSKREWFKILKERAIDSLAESRIFASAQYGLPNDLRSYIWTALARVHHLQAKHKDVSYHELSSKESSWEYVIEKDVVRTLVDDPFFRHPEFKGGEKLSRLLKAYANFDPELGYTQGMNTVAAVILMVMSGYGADQRTWKRKIHSRTCERNAFWILVYIMIERQYRRCFIDNYPRLMETLEIFDKTLKDQIPQIVQHMKTYDVSIQAVFMHQFMTVAGQDSPHEFSIRMMDLFLVKGDFMIVHVLVRTLQACQEEIFARKDESLFRYLKHDMIITAYNKYRNNLNKLFVLETES